MMYFCDNTDCQYHIDCDPSFVRNGVMRTIGMFGDVVEIKNHRYIEKTILEYKDSPPRNLGNSTLYICDRCFKKK